MKPETYPFVARPLPYEYYALAPVLSMETMTYHHDKHYTAYVEKLNDVLSDYPQLQDMSLQELLMHKEELPTAIRGAVRNNGGGVFNHALFFDSMHSINPKEKADGQSDPSGELADAINRDFGGYKYWKEKMLQAAVGQFGSGWAWLVSDGEGVLSILQTANQDVPDLAVYTPLFLVDVWEHAYYLQYQNRRAEYVEKWFELINWRKAQKRYEQRTGRV